MLQPLCIPNAFFWSHLQLQDSLVANSYFLVTGGGNAVVDPLPVDKATDDELKRLGGIAKVLVTTPDHARESEMFAERYGAEIIDDPGHEEEVLPGITTIRLLNQKSDREFAIHLGEHRAVIVGDSLLGAPAGGLSMLSDGKYSDMRKAALGLRRILRVNPKMLLVGHGQSIFSGAYDTLYRLLYARAGAELHRINLDELDFRVERDEHDTQPAKYHVVDAEVGFAIGARKLGYRVSTLDPGKVFCPLHSHAREEELFFVLDGEPTVRTPLGKLLCRKGDFIALPVGETGAHQLLNESKAPVTVLLLARTEEVEACYYPDSDKLMVDTDVPFVRAGDSIMVQGSPLLDYFHGE